MCISTCTHTLICVYIYICICVYIYMYVCIYIYTHTRTHVHNLTAIFRGRGHRGEPLPPCGPSNGMCMITMDGYDYNGY